MMIFFLLNKLMRKFKNKNVKLSFLPGLTKWHSEVALSQSFL